MSKLAIIVFDMLPYSSTWGGCQRMYYMATDLAKTNDVSVISFKKNAEENYYGKEVKFNQVIFDCKSERYQQYLCSRDTQQSKTVTEKKNSLKKRIKQNISRFFFNEPFSGFTCLAIKDWIKENQDKICKYINDEEIKNVIISGPPFSMYALIPIIRKNCINVNIIMDYRDPWNLWKYGSVFTWKKEKKYLQCADIISVTNENLREGLSTKFKMSSSKIHVIANGYREEDWRNIEEFQQNIETDKFVFSYVGSVDISDSEKSAMRGVNELLTAFSMLADKYNDVKLRIVGANHIDDDYLSRVMGSNRECVEALHPVPNEEALKYEMNSSALILIHNSVDNSSQYLISGKFYDYLRAGKPVISIHMREGLHSKVVGEYGVGLSAYNNYENIFSVMEQMYIDWKNGLIDKYKCKIDIKSFSREVQNMKMKELLK